MYVLSGDSKLLVTKAVRGANIDRFSISIEKGIVGHVFRSRKGLIISSPYTDKRFDKSLDQERKSLTRNMLCVPIKLGGNAFGCLELANKSAAFTKDDLHFASSVAKELALGLSNKLTPNSLEFKEESSRILSPLVKNVLIILADTLKAER